MQSLRRGSTGVDVIAWQNVLIAGDVPEGWPDAWPWPIAADGVFGERTEFATKVWQRAHGLIPTGTVLDATWDAAGIKDPVPVVPVQGTDISVIQGKVPWSMLKAMGHEFSFIRCKVGNNPGRDVRFLENLRACLDAGIRGRPYHFPFALPHIDPVEEAKGFADASIVDGHVFGSKPNEGPPAYDLEWPPPEEWAKRGCSADQIVDRALAALEQMTKDFRCEPIVYSYPYYLFMLSPAKNFRLLVKYRLWIAGGGQYLNGDGSVPRKTDRGWVDVPPTVRGWGDNWLFWQHDGNGGRRLPNGVDADFNVFRYDLLDLARLDQTVEHDVPSVPPLDDSNIADAVAAFHTATMTGIIEDAIHAHRQARIERIFADAA